ncbi:hypothetical protein CBS101457_001838 [Exobasidium rhododendri]|nr:hypothetical protein CBS101457_001838 [Exobasidium rhododendri]
MLRSAVVTALCVALAAAKGSKEPASAAFEWILSLDYLNQSSFTAQPYVSNGYIGSRLPAVGVGYQEFSPLPDNAQENGQGWPLFGPRRTATMVAGFYDVQNSTIGTNFPQTKGGEQVIALLPSWTSLYLTVTRTNDSKEATFAPGVLNATVTDYKQTMSIRSGEVSTSLVWTPEGFGAVHLNYTVLAHRHRPNLGMMRLQVDCKASHTNLIISDVLDGQGAQRTQSHHAGHAQSQSRTIYSTVQPHWVNDVTAWMFSSLQATEGRSDHSLKSVPLPATVGQIIDTNDSATVTQSFAYQGQKVDVWKAVGIATSDAYSPDEKRIAFTTAKKARKAGWEALIKEHRSTWETIWSEGGDIILHSEDASNQRLQIQARASLFHLLTNVRQGKESRGLGDNSIAPAGLTSDSYAGSIFWDAETFMAPSLLLLFPTYVESILNYRYKLPWQTIANAQQFQRPGALYPWVSARFQNDTGIGPTYDYEYHLNNDIALLAWQYYQQTQNRTFLADIAWPIMSRLSHFWAAQVVMGSDGQYHTMNLTDPDEFANHKNDGAFTNAGIAIILQDTITTARILNKGNEIGGNWTDIADKIAILHSDTSNITLEFEGFSGTTQVKQADVPLLIYPLEFDKHYPAKEADPTLDLAFHAARTSSNGPGMTYSIYGIVSAELSTEGCETYTRLLQAGMPYEREFSQFSEQVIDSYADNNGTNPAYTFLTGHGGLLQMYTHGFTGYRVRRNGIYLDPVLPPQLAPGITIKGIKYGCSTFDIHIGQVETKITHRSGKVVLHVEIASRNRKAGQYVLQVGQSIQVDTTQTHNVGNNLAQCKAITTTSEGINGNYAVAAIDGSNATYYQPPSDEPSAIIIDTYKKQTLHSVHVTFTQSPAKLVSISTSIDNQTYTAQVTDMIINITQPYNAQTIALVQLPVLNTTVIPLGDEDQKGVYARYLKLIVQGSVSTEGQGAGAGIASIVIRVSSVGDAT